MPDDVTNDVIKTEFRVGRSLHAELASIVRAKKKRDPGASMNSTIIEALEEYIRQHMPKGS